MKIINFIRSLFQIVQEFWRVGISQKFHDWKKARALKRTAAGNQSQPLREEVQLLALQVKWQKLGTIFQTLIALVGFFFLFYQIKLLRDSVDQQKLSNEIGGKAIDFAKKQTEIALQAYNDEKQSEVPIIGADSWNLQPDISNLIPNDEASLSISLLNRGKAGLSHGTIYYVIEFRKSEPPLNYERNWKTLEDVMIRPNWGERSLEIPIVFSQEQIFQLKDRKIYLYVFGFLDFPNSSGNVNRQQFCVRFGKITSKCNTWQNEEQISK